MADFGSNIHIAGCLLVLLFNPENESVCSFRLLVGFYHSTQRSQKRVPLVSSVYKIRIQF
jgi:hypothetical protein